MKKYVNGQSTADLQSQNGAANFDIVIRKNKNLVIFFASGVRMDD